MTALFFLRFIFKVHNRIFTFLVLVIILSGFEDPNTYKKISIDLLKVFSICQVYLHTFGREDWIFLQFLPVCINYSLTKWKSYQKISCNILKTLNHYFRLTDFVKLSENELRSSKWLLGAFGPTTQMNRYSHSCAPSLRQSTVPQFKTFYMNHNFRWRTSSVNSVRTN